MPNSYCPNCKLDFYYDESVNVKYFEAAFNNIGFRAGGDFPICPTCELQCQRESSINFDKNQLKISYKRFQIKL